LVLLVTPLVNSLMFPTTFPEKVCTLLTMEAAKSEPGRLGRETLPPPPDGTGAALCGVPGS
jgi:hypothetical protein